MSTRTAHKPLGRELLNQPQSQSIRLLAPSPSFAAPWLKWRHQPSCVQHNPLETLPEQALKERLTTCQHQLNIRADEYRWFPSTDGIEPFGTVAMTSPSWRLGYAYIGYHIAESHQGQGLGTSSVALLVEKIFSETQMHRLCATINEHNTASRTLIERLGFVHEGTMREHFLLQGERTNVCLYALLRNEWVL